ncbi:spore germination protein [Anaerosolibacter sp.]|uniref:spore germination protein n=1 Tax=Anaerosolibacter sp. TaxID=1872527 RepID=UPI0039EEAF7A
MLNRLLSAFNRITNRDDVPHFKTRELEEINYGKLSHSLHINVENIKQAFGHSKDLNIREVKFPSKETIVLVFINGLINTNELNKFVIEFLSFTLNDVKQSYKVLDLFEIKTIPTTSMLDLNTYEDVYSNILDGLVIALLEGSNKGFALNFTGGDKRQIQDSQLEKNLRGPRDALVEDLDTNMSILRKKIKDIKLQVDDLTIGSRSKTKVNIVYMRDIANPNIVQDLKSRLENIDYDNIQDGTYIGHLINDNPLSFFPLILKTEKPDKIAANLLEGRIAVITENSPTALLLPSVFFDFLEVQDDYYDAFFITVATRILRVIGLILATMSTPLYISLTAINIDMLPTKLAIPFSQIRYVVPFPLIVEVLIMEITLELLREAGLRIPNPIGPAVSIVGGLVIGQTAVNAGLTSPFLTIIVAISAIGSFTIPSVDLVATLRIVKFFLVIGASVFGLYGIGMALTLLVIHINSIKTFGVPYLSPFNEEGIINSLKTIIRLPFIITAKRHSYYRINNKYKVRK